MHPEVKAEIEMSNKIQARYGEIASGLFNEMNSILKRASIQKNPEEAKLSLMAAQIYATLIAGIFCDRKV